MHVMHESASAPHIHDHVTHAKEFRAIESLGEEVGQVVSGGHEGDHQLTRLDDLAHVEVTALDVLSFLISSLPAFL